MKMMDATKQARLEAQGWKVGNVDEFLELTPEESISNPANRASRAEQGDLSVSFDLLLRAMLATGATPQEIGQVIAEVAA